MHFNIPYDAFCLVHDISCLPFPPHFATPAKKTGGRMEERWLPQVKLDLDLNACWLLGLTTWDWRVFAVSCFCPFWGKWMQRNGEPENDIVYRKQNAVIFCELRRKQAVKTIRSQIKPQVVYEFDGTSWVLVMILSLHLLLLTIL